MSTLTIRRRPVGGTSVAPPKEPPRFQLSSVQASPSGYGADRSRLIRKADDPDAQRATGRSTDAAPLLAGIAPGLTGLAADRQQGASPKQSSTIVANNFTDSFYEPPSDTASQIKQNMDGDFWRNQGVMQNRANEQRAQGVNDRVGAENFSLQQMHVNQNYGISNRNADAANQRQLQSEASAQAMSRQQNAMAHEAARNAANQMAETERQRLANNTQLQLGALQSFSNSVGAGNFRYW